MLATDSEPPLKTDKPSTNITPAGQAIAASAITICSTTHTALAPIIQDSSSERPGSPTIRPLQLLVKSLAVQLQQHASEFCSMTANSSPGDLIDVELYQRRSILTGPWVYI